jgi:hypothetical protein
MIAGKQLHKAMETTIHVDVVNNDCSAWSQNRPRTVYLEADITLAMQAVVNEKINLSEVGQQFRQTSPARAEYVRPPTPKSVANCNSNFLFPLRLHWRPIDAPKATVPISLKSLKNEAGSDAVGNSTLDNISRLQMTEQAPNCSHKTSITVVPTLEARRTCTNSYLLHFGDDSGP